MEENKKSISSDAGDINKLINDIDSRITELREKKLEGKSESERQQLLGEWQEEDNKRQKKIEEERRNFEEELAKKFSTPEIKLQSINDMKKDMKDWQQKIDDDYKKTINDVLLELEKNIKTENDRAVYESVRKSLIGD